MSSPRQTRSKAAALGSRPSIHKLNESKESDDLNKSKAAKESAFPKSSDNKNASGDPVGDVSEDEEEDKELSNESDKSVNHERRSPENDVLTDSQRIQDNSVSMGLAGFFILFLIAVAFGALSKESELPIDDPRMNLDLVKEEFPAQNQNLWWNFKSGVQSIITNDQPSSIILVYTPETEQTLKNLLPNLIQYVSCHITNCDEKPIKLTNKELNSPEVLANYGVLIERYKDELEEKGVMLVENLENVKGASANVFHTFCDEYTPLVRRSMFIFTMKVEEIPKTSTLMGYIENHLKEKWNDIKLDSLVALITRVANVICVVEAEATNL